MTHEIFDFPALGEALDELVQETYASYRPYDWQTATDPELIEAKRQASVCFLYFAPSETIAHESRHLLRLSATIPDMS